MRYVPRVVYTVIAAILVGLGLGVLGTVIDPEGVLWFAAFVVGGLLVSLTDRRSFGWIE